MTALAANKIRIKGNYRSTDYVVDAISGNSPVALRGLPLHVEFACFDADTIIDNLANIDSVTLVIKDRDTPDAMAYVSETLDGSLLTACLLAAWTGGTGQHGIIVVDGSDLELPAAIYWMGLFALLTDGTTLRLARASLDLQVSGSSGSGGSAFLTAAQGDARYMQRAIANGSFRASSNGQHLQLYNATTAQWHSLIAAGPAGAVTLALDQTGED